MLLKKNHCRASDFLSPLIQIRKGLNSRSNASSAPGSLSSATTDPVVAEACRRSLEIFFSLKTGIWCEETRFSARITVFLQCGVFSIPMLAGDTIFRTTQRRNQDAQPNCFRNICEAAWLLCNTNYPSHQTALFSFVKKSRILFSFKTHIYYYIY